MKDGEHPSIPVLVVEVLRPMVLAATIMAAPFAIALIVTAIVFTPTLHPVIGVACGAFAIWRVVRSLNRWCDLKNTKPPQDAS